MVAAMGCVLVLGACNGGGSRGSLDGGIGDSDDPLDTPEPAGPEAMTDVQLQTIAELDGLYSRHRDVAVVCQEDASARTPEDPFPSCDVAIVDAGGGVELLGFDDVRNAQRLAGDHLLIVRRDLEMVMTDASGSELRSFGRSFTSPHVRDDGIHVLVLTYPEAAAVEGTRPSSNIELVDAFTGEREILIDDPGAYAPYEVPGTEKVVFVSGRSGLASLWLREADGTELQLSNRATTTVGGKGWTPVPVHELSFMPDNPALAVYSARVDGHHELFLLDTAAGRVDRIGPGRMPARRDDGRMLVVTSDKGGVRTVALPVEVLPSTRVPEEALP